MCCALLFSTAFAVDTKLTLLVIVLQTARIDTPAASVILV
jgi:hypothetical protein